MAKTLTIDGHIWTQREDGLYTPDVEYEVDKKWGLRDETMEYTMLAKCVDDVLLASLLAHYTEDRAIVYGQHKPDEAVVFIGTAPHDICAFTLEEGTV